MKPREDNDHSSLFICGIAVQICVIMRFKSLSRRRGWNARMKPACSRRRSQNPGGRSPTTLNARSSAMPACTKRAFVEQRPSSVMPCGTRRGGLNFGSGFAGSGAQSLRASDTFTNPARSVSDGWPVKFEIVSISSRSDGTSRRSTFANDSRHLRRHLAAEAIGLHEVDGRQESRLAKEIRPRVGHLHLELIRAAVERELLERRRRLGEEDQLQRVVRPIGERDLDRHHADRLIVSSAARSTSVAGASFIHAGK